MAGGACAIPGIVSAIRRAVNLYALSVTVRDKVMES